jgi:hypothetical protein
MANAFRSVPTKQLVVMPSNINTIRESRSQHHVLLFEKENGEDEEEGKIEDRIVDPADIEDLPMFSLEYNSENVDYSQLPVPPFTSAVVFFASTAFTIYLYYVGLTGGVATAPGS